MSKIIGVGTDIVEVGRVLKSCEKHSFLNKYYTEAERELIKRRKSCAATNFAGKEAVAKAFGTGFLNCMPEDIEILRDEKGKPYVNLSEKAEKIVKENNTEIKDLITYNQLNIAGIVEGSNFSLQREFGLGSVDKVKFMTVITLDDYNKVAKTNKTLKSDEILLYVDKKGTYDYDQLNINGDNLKVKEKMS